MRERRDATRAVALDPLPFVLPSIRANGSGKGMNKHLTVKTIPEIETPDPQSSAINFHSWYCSPAKGLFRPSEGGSLIEFFIDPYSLLPAHSEIQEQVKLALLLRTLRPGDTLPSIRDVEKQTGVGRSVVRKAYMSLQRLGILSLRQGKGVVVASQRKYGERGDLTEHCEKLSSSVLTRAHRLGIAPSAFARYLYQRARILERATPFVIYVDVTKPIALERAAMISQSWGVNVPGISLEEMRGMRQGGLNGVRVVLTNYYRLEQVQKLAKGRVAEVLPLSLIYSAKYRDQFRSLPRGSSVVLVLEDSGYPTLGMIRDIYRAFLVESSTELFILPRKKIRDLSRFVSLGKYEKIIFSDGLWNSLPEKIKKNRRVTYPQMEIDPSTLDDARNRAGIIL
jgi:GntR family transcriptional regulator